MGATERWSRVSAILSEALDMPEVEREAFLAGQAARHPDLRTDVMAMWAELSRTGSFLEQPLPGPPPPAGGTLGPYRIVGELGEGGMGVVHLAERIDGQFTRKVAIKRIGSLAAFDALRRFGEERQILARLDHANITRLLDSGVDDSGVPYLVMEHVEGVPLIAYCRQHALTVPARLALFLKVCAAVQHAHQHLVIHRDIKPGNILVTATGEPKLLDFGIAKALGESAPQDVTRTAHPALTLDYASPEQVRGHMVTTASDVYSLGVLLYELLAGRKAYELGEHSLAEGVRLVCELTPRPPSEVAPPEQSAALRGDLDAIVAKAMEKAPADRYASVAELAADVTAHLDHQPVKARRPSFAYVARKFVRRHRAGVAVAGTGALLLAAGVAAVLWQARVAERERARAQRRFDEVRQLAHYVIFELHDGVNRLPGSTELRRQMIERSLAYLDSLANEAAGDPQLQAELAEAYSRLGDVLGRRDVANLGDRAGALRSFVKARELLRQAVAGRPGDPVPQRALAGVLIKLHGAVEGDDERQALLNESMAIWEKLAAADPSDDNLHGLASAHFSAYLGLDVDPAAIPHMEQSLAIFRRLLDAKPDDDRRKRNVALCHKYLGERLILADDARAAEHMREAARLDGERLAADPQNPQVRLDYTFDLSVLGSFHLFRGEYAEAERLFTQVLDHRRAILAADPADTQARERLADTLVRLTSVHVFAGRPLRGRPFLQESAALLRGRPEHDKTVARTLVYLHLYLGEIAYAEGGDACSSYRRMAEVKAAVRDQAEAGFREGPAAAFIDRALERLESCGGGPRARD